MFLKEIYGPEDQIMDLSVGPFSKPIWASAAS